MTHIGVYDDTAAVIEEACNRLDVTEAELIDMLLDEIEADDDELGGVIQAAKEAIY